MTDILTDFGVNLPALTTSVVNFAILAVVLWFVMVKPLITLIEQREQTIRSSLERAELERQEAAVLEKKLAEDRRVAVERARTMVIDAETKAAAIVKQAVIDAEAKAAAITVDASLKATRDREQLINDATGQLGNLVADATRIVIGRAVTPSIDQTIVREAIAAASRAAER
jgi:F-type H+-transporting ATPase subunit b